MLRLQISTHGAPPPRKIQQAVDILHRGGVAAYPTDSCYALGCAIEAKQAALRIYQAKSMSQNHRMALICPDIASASEYVHFSQLAYKLAKRIFPGPYTLVLPATREVPKLVIDKKQRTAGIRITSNPVAQALVNALGRPLLTSTAILPDEDGACIDADETIDAFGHILDVVVDSESPGDEPTTVVEVAGNDVNVLREGVGPLDGIFEE
ncbi:L-threonylcarbamoyladenylate synthase [Haliangium ochraceum]|uniref:Sua5/YciO/YrdC/YwlC family protein n=1 Tax=Haliangium ochraceum (strain DSM 14365 / JCM 11303 / SMP-2) TaxID=502025 RepID=D0LT47_HALO1|nr:L-threonylcarbamoyladenylate synthase [Haliangium ochraceum]ACY19183.1 Sua5/YciO/YrdC/YwlC family protein [Haliangium ochraceum DSM 14365]